MAEVSRLQAWPSHGCSSPGFSSQNLPSPGEAWEEAQPQAFFSDAKAMLEAAPALHQLTLAAAHEALREPMSRRLFLCRRAGAVVGAVAFKTLPAARAEDSDALRVSVAGEVSKEAAEGFFSFLGPKELRCLPAVGDVAGPPQPARAFAEACARHQGKEVVPKLDTEAMSLRHAPAVPSTVPGHMRAVTSADDPVLLGMAAWATHFAEDALGDAPVSQSESSDRLRAMLRDGKTLFVWERDGKPVAVAAMGRDLERTGCCLSFVFTARSERGHGYGGAVVAAACAELLTRRVCVMLFVDISSSYNTVKLYERLGFKREGNHVGLFFE
mmetsp:Transcript_72519/g.222059  ORF Transcript_72519/g.222059 Transcript_72519/m.222059 type:complete len:327 (-) Transcript_72519:319-1299(-)